MWLIIIVMGLLLMFINSCENPISDNYDMVIDPRLDVDTNGYFHLGLDINKWQTIHRFSGSIHYKGNPVENVRVEWESDFYWVLSDTAGYVVDYAYTDDLVYIAIDTSYIYFGQEQFLVPIVNPVSLTNSDGEFNCMFAPVLSQRGDTVSVFVNVLDNGTNFKVILD